PAPVSRPPDRRQGYAYANRAAVMSDAFADAPPDYAFDYGGVRPWIWRARDRSQRVVEPVPGGERYYYYEPGEDAPFRVRARDYSSGYAHGRLAVVYDRQGRALPPDVADQRAEEAGRYLARARAIYAASQREQRQAIARANWAERRANLDRQQSE